MMHTGVAQIRAYGAMASNNVATRSFNHNKFSPQRAVSFSPRHRGLASTTTDNQENKAKLAAMRFSIQTFIIRNQLSVVSWFSLLVIVLGCFHLISDGDFSFLLTLGAVVRAFACAIVVTKLKLERNASGLSGNTLCLSGLALAARLCSILPYEDYLPYDSTGDWFYQMMESLALVFIVVSGMLYSRHLPSKALLPATFDSRPVSRTSGDAMNNNGSAQPISYYVVGAVVVGCATLALFIHPNLNGHVVADVAWTFACYVETFAMVPQLRLFMTTKGFVNTYISNWVFAMGVGHLLDFCFWAASHHELNSINSTDGSTIVGWIVLAMQLGQMVLMMNFIYHYMKSALLKVPMTMPTTSVVFNMV